MNDRPVMNANCYTDVPEPLKALHAEFAKLELRIAALERVEVPGGVTVAATRAESECQTCGRVGGKVVTFQVPGGSRAQWVCPWCMDTKDAATPITPQVQVLPRRFVGTMAYCVAHDRQACRECIQLVRKDVDAANETIGALQKTLEDANSVIDRLRAEREELYDAIGLASPNRTMKGVEDVVLRTRNALQLAQGRADRNERVMEYVGKALETMKRFCVTGQQNTIDMLATRAMEMIDALNSEVDRQTDRANSAELLKVAAERQRDAQAQIGARSSLALKVSAWLERRRHCFLKDVEGELRAILAPHGGPLPTPKKTKPVPKKKPAKARRTS